MTKHHFRAVLVFAALLAAGPLRAVQTETVTVSSTAASDYIRPKNPAGSGLQPETYIFAQGHYLGGNTKEGGLGKATFSDIIRILVPSLARQNYQPTADVPAADLVIYVHWGMTQVYEDPQRAANIEKMNDALATYQAGKADNGVGDGSGLNTILDQQATGQQSAGAAIARNATLLGYTRFLERERRNIAPTTDEQTMNEELNEERYFVILMAYDNQPKKQLHKQRLLWVTRLSVRTPGTNFADALPALSKVGAENFGQQRDELVRVKTPIQRGSVKLGDLEILGTVSNPAPDKPADPEKKDK